MTMKRNSFWYFLALMSCSTWAAPITVNNFSFETLAPTATQLTCSGTGCSFTSAPTPGSAIPGWTATPEY